MKACLLYQVVKKETEEKKHFEEFKLNLASDKMPFKSTAEARQTKSDIFGILIEQCEECTIIPTQGKNHGRLESGVWMKNEASLEKCWGRRKESESPRNIYRKEKAKLMI